MPLRFGAELITIYCKLLTSMRLNETCETSVSTLLRFQAYYYKQINNYKVLVFRCSYYIYEDFFVLRFELGMNNSYSWFLITLSGPVKSKVQ